ncbi:MAG: alpha-amylase, partial [Propionibacteriaceae bacterium]
MLDADWWRQAVVYQVYPRSFADSDGDGLGDIPGVTSRIGYLAELGVDAIWLSPFYPSALADGGYDVDDYRDVAPELGTLTDFDALVGAAHAVGIKIVVDIVPNHTSNRHAWFREALASAPGSAARNRYVFRDGTGPDGSLPPSDWQSHFGGPAWTRLVDADGRPEQWYLHLFAPEQPDLNWDNREVHEEFLTTLRFWADRGVDGYRVDVAHALAKDLSEPLRSKPETPGELPVDGSDPLFDRNEVHEIYAEWRAVFDEYDPPRTAVAEAFSAPERRALYARPTGLGQAFNFDLLKADFDATEFREVVDFCLAQAATVGSSSTWVLSNHDVVRHATRYGLPTGTDLDAWLLTDGRSVELDEAQGLRRARAALLFMLALPGSAYLYQGEELGLHEVADLEAGVLQDPIW